MAGGDNMANNAERLGASFAIDVTNLKEGLTLANRLIRESESEFKAAAAGMDDWRTSEEGLTARIESLNKITGLQESKVKALNENYKKLVDEGLDESSAYAVQLRININKENEALSKNKLELEKNTKALFQMAQEAQDAAEAQAEMERQAAETAAAEEKARLQAEKSKKAFFLFGKQAKETADNVEDLGDESKKSAGKVKETGKAAEDTGEKFAGLKAAGGIAVGAIAAVGAACTAAVGSFFGLAESTREARQNMAQLETSFEGAGHTAEAAESTFTELYGVLGDEGKATEAAQQLAQFSKTEKDLAANTRILTGVMATYGESIPTEGLAEGMAASAAMSSVQGTLADALEWQGVNLDAYNEKLASMATEEERAAYIQQTLTDLYGDAADAYMENNAAVIDANKAQAELNAGLAELGAIAEPIMTTLKLLVVDLLKEIKPFVKLIGEGMQGAFSGTEGAADKLAAGLGGILSTAVDKLAALAPTAIDTLIAVVPQLLNSLLAQLPAISQALVSLVLQLTPPLLSAILGALPVILKTLMVMVGQIATGLGNTLLPTLLPLAVDAVVQLAETLIDNIDFIIDAAIQLIIGLADGIVFALPKLVAKVPVIIEKLIRALVANLPKLQAMGMDLILKLGMGLIAAIPELLSAIPQIIMAIINGFKGGVGDLKGVGGDLIRGLWDGIKDMSKWITNKLKGFGESVLGGIKDFFGIHSPSKVMADEVGKNLALGIGEGFADNIGAVNKMITGAVDVGGVGTVGNIGGRTAGGGVVVYQTNNYAQAHSRVELYKTKQATAAAVRLAMQGA